MALLAGAMILAGPSSLRGQDIPGAAQAQQLVFSTFLGGSIACADCSDVQGG